MGPLKPLEEGGMNYFASKRGPLTTCALDQPCCTFLPAQGPVLVVVEGPDFKLCDFRVMQF